MADSPFREVAIGDSNIRIARFRGLKAILAGALVARVTRELPEIQDRVTEYTKKFREDHYVEITPAMAKWPRFVALGLEPEDFTASGGTVKIPDEPSWQQIMIAMLPDLFDLARKEVMRFLALIAIPNSELEQADDADQVDQALDAKAKEILRQGDIEEILEILVVGWEVLEDQLLSKQEQLGKLRNLPFLKGLLSTPPEIPTEEQETEEQGTDQTPPTSPDDVQTSSTTSESSTDGTDGQPSMEPLGTN